MTGSRNGQQYQVDPIHSHHFTRSNTELQPSANISTTESYLWHKCLAPLNHIAIKPPVDSHVPTDICEVCIVAKHERKIIRVPELQTMTPFEPVHSDTCSPLPPNRTVEVYISLYLSMTIPHKEKETCVSTQRLVRRAASVGIKVRLKFCVHMQLAFRWQTTRSTSVRTQCQAGHLPSTQSTLLTSVET